jgi:glycosyltransferase involved in cell wall biosynthesis
MTAGLPPNETLTIAICTWNRAPLLAMTLERLCAPGVLSGGCEVLVVDNGSTDGTPDVVARYKDRLPLRMAHESEQGISPARNRALDEASGTHLLYIDDDVLVGPGWLEAYRAAFRAHPDAGVFGGPIRTRFLGTPPAWLVQSLPLVASAYAVRELGPREFRLEPVPAKLPYGANMAFRLDQARQHRFDPVLGRVRKGMVGGEEIAFMARMLQAGATGWWVPGAGVEHLLPRTRQTLRYLRGYFEGLGMTQFRTEKPVRGRFELAGVPSWLWRQYATARLRYWLARLASPVTVWLPRFGEFATYRGRVRSYRAAVAKP